MHQLTSTNNATRLDDLFCTFGRVDDNDLGGLEVLGPCRLDQNLFKGKFLLQPAACLFDTLQLTLKSIFRKRHTMVSRVSRR